MVVAETAAGVAASKPAQAKSAFPCCERPMTPSPKGTARFAIVTLCPAELMKPMDATSSQPMIWRAWCLINESLGERPQPRHGDDNDDTTNALPERWFRMAWLLS